MLTSRRVADAAPFAAIAITSGVLAAEALALFPKHAGDRRSGKMSRRL